MNSDLNRKSIEQCMIDTLNEGVYDKHKFYLSSDKVWDDHKFYFPNLPGKEDYHMLCVSHNIMTGQCYLQMDLENMFGIVKTDVIDTIHDITTIDQLAQILKSDQIQYFKNMENFLPKMPEYMKL